MSLIRKTLIGPAIILVIFMSVIVSFAETIYTYDDMNRLVWAEYRDGTTKCLHYQYDEVGNRLLKETYTGVCLIPRISVNPASYNFGSVNVGSSSAPRTFTVSNVGTSNLVLGTLSLTGTNPAQFIKQNDTCSGQTLPPSSNCSAQIIFSPTSTGTKTANLSIPSNDVQTPTINASLSGTGVCLDPVRVGSPPTYYSTLQAAYDAASNGSVIQSRAITFTENLLINRNITVTLQGGYDCGYTSNSGNVTYLKGKLQTVSGGGKLTIGNFIISQ